MAGKQGELQLKAYNLKGIKGKLCFYYFSSALLLYYISSFLGMMRADLVVTGGGDSIFIYLFIKQRPKSRYHGVGAHQYQRKREEGKKGRRAKKRTCNININKEEIGKVSFVEEGKVKYLVTLR